jgi:hypothetical protein
VAPEFSALGARAVWNITDFVGGFFSGRVPLLPAIVTGFHSSERDLTVLLRSLLLWSGVSSSRNSVFES